MDPSPSHLVPVKEKELNSLSEALRLDPKVIEKIPEDIRLKLAIAVKRTQITRFSGPIPPPEHMAEYEKVLPGAADRILTMAEEQAKHRRKLEATAIPAQLAESKLGQIIAFVVSFTCIVGSVIVACEGHDSFASVLGGATVLGLTANFIGGKYIQLQNLGKKNPE